MKIRVPNELVFTVFFGKENASERIKNIFEKVYGDVDKAFKNSNPKVAYDSKTQNNCKNSNLTWK